MSLGDVFDQTYVSEQFGLPWTRDPFDMLDHSHMYFYRLMSLQKGSSDLTEYDQIIFNQLKNIV